MARYRSSPAVSQIWALMMKPLSSTVRVLNSTPMVVRLSWLNSFLVKRDSRLLFPTPDSPIRTTVRGRKKKSDGDNWSEMSLQNQKPWCFPGWSGIIEPNRKILPYPPHPPQPNLIFVFSLDVSLLHTWWILCLGLSLRLVTKLGKHQKQHHTLEENLLIVSTWASRMQWICCVNQYGVLR